MSTARSTELGQEKRRTAWRLWAEKMYQRIARLRPSVHRDDKRLPIDWRGNFCRLADRFVKKRADFAKCESASQSLAVRPASSELAQGTVFVIVVRMPRVVATVANDVQAMVMMLVVSVRQ